MKRVEDLKIVQKFTIQCRLPGLNEVVGANRSNAYMGAALKHKADDAVRWAIRVAKLKPIKGAAHIKLHFVEQNRRRDPDNIYSAVKFVLDALVKEGILENDSQRILKPPRPIEYSYEIGNVARVDVEIEEAGNE